MAAGVPTAVTAPVADAHSTTTTMAQS